MKRVIKYFLPLVLLGILLTVSTSCGGIAGGAQVRIEGINLGSVSMEGKR